MASIKDGPYWLLADPPRAHLSCYSRSELDLPKIMHLDLRGRVLCGALEAFAEHTITPLLTT